MADQNLPEGTDTILTDAELAGTGGDLGAGGTTAPGKGSESSFGSSGTAGTGSSSVGSTPGIGRSDDGFDSTGAEADLITTGVDMSTETSGAGSTGSNGSSGRSGSTGSTGSNVSDTSSSGSGRSTSGGLGSGVKQALLNSTDKLRSTAGDKALGLVGQGLERSRDTLTNVSSIISDTAANLDERLGTQYGDYARSAAEAIERAASGLADKDPEELVDDARTFVRKSPGVALAGAAILGFALVRVVKSGLEGGATSGSTRGSAAGTGTGGTGSDQSL